MSDLKAPLLADIAERSQSADANNAASASACAAAASASASAAIHVGVVPGYGSALDNDSPPLLHPPSRSPHAHTNTRHLSSGSSQGVAILPAHAVNKPTVRLETLSKRSIKSLLAITYLSIIGCLLLGMWEGELDAKSSQVQGRTTFPNNLGSIWEAEISIEPLELYFGLHVDVSRTTTDFSAVYRNLNVTVEIFGLMTSSIVNATSFDQDDDAAAASAAASASSQLAISQQRFPNAILDMQSSLWTYGGDWFGSVSNADCRNGNSDSSINSNSNSNGFRSSTSSSSSSRNSGGVGGCMVPPVVERQIPWTRPETLGQTVPATLLYRRRALRVIECGDGSVSCSRVWILRNEELQYQYKAADDFPTFLVRLHYDHTYLDRDVGRHVSYTFDYHDYRYRIAQIIIHALICVVTIVVLFFWVRRLQRRVNAGDPVVPEQKWISGLLVALLLYANPFFSIMLFRPGQGWELYSGFTWILALSYFLFFWLAMQDGIRATKSNLERLPNVGFLDPADFDGKNGYGSLPRSAQTPRLAHKKSLGTVLEGSEVPPKAASSDSQAVSDYRLHISDRGSSSSSLPVYSDDEKDGKPDSQLDKERRFGSLRRRATTASSARGYKGFIPSISTLRAHMTSLFSDRGSLYSYNWGFYVPKLILVLILTVSLTWLLALKAEGSGFVNTTDAGVALDDLENDENRSLLIVLFLCAAGAASWWTVWMLGSVLRASKALRNLPYLATRFRQISFRFFLLQTWLIILYLGIITVIESARGSFNLSNNAAGRVGKLSNIVLMSIYIHMVAFTYAPAVESDGLPQGFRLKGANASKSGSGSKSKHQFGGSLFGSLLSFGGAGGTAGNQGDEHDHLSNQIQSFSLETARILCDFAWQAYYFPPIPVPDAERRKELFGAHRRQSLVDAHNLIPASKSDLSAQDGDVAAAAAAAAAAIVAEDQNEAQLEARMEEQVHLEDYMDLSSRGWDLLFYAHTPVTDTSCFVARSGQRIVISFRGTASTKNALVDLQLAQTFLDLPGVNDLCKVHGGFARSWQGLKRGVLECVWKLIADDDRKWNETPDHMREPLSFFVTGHSLGGALANLCALTMKLQISDTLKRPLAIQVYTFGQPRVGNHIFAGLYDKHVPLTFRVVCDRDMISTLPKLFVFYKHCGLEIIIDRRGNCVVDPSWLEKMMLSSRRSLKDHSLRSYIAALESCLLLHEMHLLTLDLDIAPSPLRTDSSSSSSKDDAKSNESQEGKSDGTEPHPRGRLLSVYTYAPSSRSLPLAM